MDLLPKEMMLEIFQFLQTRELLALTAVSRNFNQIINTERLLDKIPLYLNVDEEKLAAKEFIARGASYLEVKSFIKSSLIDSSRKYTRIVIGNIEGEDAIECLQKWSTNVKQLTFRRGCYSLKHICKILVVCPNIKRLRFCRGSLRGDINIEGCELPKLALKALHLENVGSQIFKVLKESKVFKIPQLIQTTKLLLISR